MTTTAYSSFLKTLNITKELLRLESTNFPAAPKPAQQAAVEGLRGGCAVLVVAGFEAYLKELFQEIVGSIATDTNVDFNKLPESLRVHNIFESLNRALAGPRYVETTKPSRLADIFHACRSVADRRIDADVFSETYSNPNSKTLKQMFKAVGVNDVFVKIKNDFERRAAWGTPVAERFIQDKLDEIVRRRHLVAHTAQALSITRNDLRESIKFLRVLAKRLDVCLEHHVRAVRKNARCAK